MPQLRDSSTRAMHADTGMRNDFGRIFGIETEYGVSVTGADHAVDAGQVAMTMFQPVVSKARSTNTYLTNGSRLYLDVGSHPEYATAEALDPKDALLQDLAGERIMRHLAGGAQQRLRADSRLLDDWLRRGEPLRYRLGLYQGGRLIPFVEAAINDWAPPPPPRPVIKQVVQGPQTIRLDSMALFDTGKSALKPGSTKLLVNSLLGIKAKPGWLIVVAGHTDSIGNDRSNQQLSLKRAEAVRDWMRDTGDVPESCFAVQGYGASRPVASNETPEGRAQNRRVEISLVPQKDACLTPGTANTSGAETNGLKSETE